MEAIKNLFKLKNNPDINPQKEIVEDTEEAREQIRITYYQTGYGASIKASGNPVTFGVGLQNLYNSFENLCRKQLNEQQILKQPYLEQQEKKRTELKKRETALSIYEDQKETSQKKIDDLRFQMIDIKQNPETYGIDADRRPKAQFYIGLILLLPITIYLFVFYVSASYSAFFKDFETSSLTAAIFAPNALSNAISDGWLEAVFVGTIPFVFMGLGYLVHMFQKTKGVSSYLKLAGLFILTFLFDVILAYLIEKKIFDFERVLGESFSPSTALQSVNFWGIIFAGFIVYIIWGLVFDFVMKEHENVDKIKAFINARKEEIKNTLLNKEKLITNLETIKHEITSIKGDITELQSKIDGFIFPVKEYLHYHYQYKEGWYQAINSELKFPQKQLDEVRDKCEEVAQKHLSELKLVDIDFQQLVFSKS
ncbi:ABC transporter permease [Polaribacter porphyrae]|uniref:ABC transporter permease n=1 Tax=Polaribacter porphyrae TaxID=1137780 RepID=A0A2S7WKM6_9FLAO|nr:ABC transporter permease [Polaribacter porphyrae]PQJ77996.1 ABC transporter permease [Polaribacter porphyrae]